METPISSVPENLAPKTGTSRELSPDAQACAAWFRRLMRALKVCRLYKNENSMVTQARDQVLETLQRLVNDRGGWTLYFTPSEAYLDEEPVIRPQVRNKGVEAAASAGEEQLPFVFFGDGIRSIHIPANVDREELEALFDALRTIGNGSVTHEDLVTLLWQANLRQIEVESVPLEQEIFVSSSRDSSESQVIRTNEKRYGWTPAGEQIHAELGQLAGTQGLHLDTFDDWELPDVSVDVAEVYEDLRLSMEYSLSHFRSTWEDENERDWSDEAIQVFREMVRLDPSEPMRRAIAHAIVTWIGESLRRVALVETQRALELLREFDPDRSLSESELVAISAELDQDAFVEYLDQAEPEEHGQFAAVAVSLGRPALDLSFAVMSKTHEPRVRAAACTALTYLCADEPHLLAPYFSDAPGDIMVHLVFTLGQIGGPEVLDLLRLAAQHPEPKVRKQVVLALGSVPAPLRMPPLVGSLESTDPGLIAASLAILTRERTPKVASAILKRVTKSDFDSLPEDTQWALFNAISDTADDDCVPSLEEMLMRGGFFARRNFARSAAARALQRIATPRAKKALSRGLRSLNSAIRGACNDVLREAA